MAGRKHGVFASVIGGVGSPGGVLADMNGWTLSMVRDRQVVTAFGDTNVIRVAGLPDFSGTLSGWWNSASSPAFFQIVLDGYPATLRLLPNAAESTFYFEGLANIDGALNVTATGAVAISGNWDAAANWVAVP